MKWYSQNHVMLHNFQSCSLSLYPSMFNGMVLHLKVPVCKSGHAFQASNTPDADFTQSRSSCVLIEILIEARSGVTILFISKIKSEQTAAESY